MTATNDALKKVGVDLGVDAASNLIGAVNQFAEQNLSPEDLATAKAAMGVLSTATNIGALSPGVVVRGTGFEWESLHYANDLNAHHPKFKFLFKVSFKGFPGGNDGGANGTDFSYFIHRCDKPKVHFNHADVNFYNFRTRVLTSTTFDPLQFTFLDEIGNSVHTFFTLYLAERSRQGDGQASIDGGADFSSSIPYKNGYSAGRTIEIQQIFANGAATNIFTLINPRIESLDHDELNMEVSAGSLLTCTVSYDAITCTTTGSTTINSWGQTDLYRGGGTSGLENAGQRSANADGQLTQTSAIGGGIGGGGLFATDPRNASRDVFNEAYNQVNSVPPSLADLVPSNSLAAPSGGNQSGTVPSSGTVISSDIQGTLSSITDGTNYSNEGRNYPASLNNVNYSNEGNNYSPLNNNPNYSNEGRNYPASQNNTNYSNEGRNYSPLNNNPSYSNEGRNAPASQNNVNYSNEGRRFLKGTNP